MVRGRRTGRVCDSLSDVGLRLRRVRPLARLPFVALSKRLGCRLEEVTDLVRGSFGMRKQEADVSRVRSVYDVSRSAS